MAKPQALIPILTIFNSRKIVLEQMKSQGYNVEDYENFSMNEVNSMNAANQLDMLIENERHQKIYIRYHLDKTIRENDVTALMQDIFGSGTLSDDDILYIIVKDDINETLTGKIRNIWDNENKYIILISLKRLQFNILTHVLQPKFRIMLPNEIVQIKTKFNVMDDNQFPDISRFDPVSKAIAIRPGEVCEIIRPSKTAIETIYYRICV